MKKAGVAEVVRDIARETSQPESVVLDMYTVVAEDMRRDARIMDFVPLLAARRVREDLKASATEPIQR